MERPTDGRWVERGRSRTWAGLIIGAACVGLGAAMAKPPGDPPGATHSRAKLDAGERVEPIRLDSPGYRKAREATPRHFVAHESRHFVALSDGTADEVRGYLALLERAKDQFDRFAARMELEGRPLKHKLVCLLFFKQKEYRSFAAKIDQVSTDWIWGYYSPEHDWIVFAVTKGPKGEQATATVLHEAIHQLVFHTGVQTRQVRYPLWICEGLATCFESESPDAAFGPGHEYEPRRKRFDRLRRDGKLLPLRDLAVIDQLEADDDDQHIDAVYQQSYALVTWMHRFRKAQLRQYMELMREQPAGRMAAAQHVAIFEQAFGDIDSIERAWLRHEAGRRADAKRRTAAASDMTESGAERLEVHPPDQPDRPSAQPRPGKSQRDDGESEEATDEESPRTAPRAERVRESLTPAGPDHRPGDWLMMRTPAATALADARAPIERRC
ncbi:MAG: DUF1570 domain-containing protein [Phycisphaerales bacterium]|nr:DUF1570 domain-containing protein [Phycisphaerales bacterium]MCI0675470.1 DUF1570 domain-containing protein [Phycisphaerales bacterium]